MQDEQSEQYSAEELAKLRELGIDPAVMTKQNLNALREGASHAPQELSPAIAAPAPDVIVQTQQVVSVQPALPCPVAEMSESVRLAYEAHVQGAREKHRIEREAKEAAALESKKAAELAASPPSSFADMQRAAESSNWVREQVENTHKLYREIAHQLQEGVSEATLIKQYGADLVARARVYASEQGLTIKPHLGRAFAKNTNAHKAADKVLYQELGAAGLLRHHAVEDFAHVLLVQLDCQAKGENPAVGTVLKRAYPEDENRAKSIGNSKNMSNALEALLLGTISEHPVTAQIASVYGGRDLQQREAYPKFCNLLAWNRTAFQMASRIASLETENAELKQQFRRAECREALEVARPKTQAEQVIELHLAEWSNQEIADEIRKKPSDVATILSKARATGKLPKKV